MFFGGDPFGGEFPGGPGGRGDGGGKVDNESYYKILGVEKTATTAEIKKAYRKLALKNHPDRGGDSAKFQEIGEAAEVLCDDNKRKLYDQYGKEGLDGRGGGGGPESANDIFSMFFGGGRGGGRQSGPKRGEDIVHPLKVSLEDLYNGKTVKLAVNRDKLCEECDGRGGKEGCEKNCGDCQGRGVKVTMRQIGPGMVQQMQSTCSSCSGKGQTIDPRLQCKSCRGKKVYKDRKVLEVVVEKGMREGQKIKFADEADEYPGTIPGDVVFVIQEKEHPRFKRKAADLLVPMELTLAECLCGFIRTIPHLDGRVIQVEVAAGEVTKPDQLKAVEGEGMPHHGNPFTKGKLFLLFKVKFPDTLPALTIRTLRSVLPAPPAPMLTGEEEQCTMHPVNIKEFGLDRGGGPRDATQEDDEDEGRGGQRVQCNNQ